MGQWDMYQGFGESLEDWGGSSGNFGLGNLGMTPSFSESFKGLDFGGFPTATNRFSGGLQGLWSLLKKGNPLTHFTGRTYGDLENTVNVPSTEYPLAQIQRAFPQWDKRMHALSSYLGARRFGALPAHLMGYGHEVASLGGGEGLDKILQDIYANSFGIDLANQYDPREYLYYRGR